MRSVSVTINQTKLLSLLLCFISVAALGQENSPYSRYGLGDIVPSGSIINRSMGGVSAAFVDYDKRFDQKDFYPKSQTVNFLNPASYSKMRITSFDLGFEVDSRTLHSIENSEKFKAASANISYVQLGIPLNRKHSLGMNIGLRPITRINYKIQQNGRVQNIDSLSTLYEGSGGTYQVYVGLGKAFGNLSVGFNTGYFFGSKDYSTRKIFVPDSFDVTYYKSNNETQTTIGGVFFDMGAQYRAQLDKKTILHLGVYGNVKEKFNGTMNVVANTFNYDANGAIQSYDTVSHIKNVAGKIDYPSTIGAGFLLEKLDKWQFGVDFTTTSWQDYAFFQQKDLVTNSWLLKVGGQISPNLTTAKNYWGRVTYRAGFNFGPDYINVDGKLPTFGISAGAGFPIRKNPYTNQYTSINLGLEYGRRGNTNNQLTENLFRVSLGLTLSDLWFIKKKYF
jgi:hypothetical protein